MMNLYLCKLLITCGHHSHLIKSIEAYNLYSTYLFSSQSYSYFLLGHSTCHQSHIKHNEEEISSFLNTLGGTSYVIQG